MRQHARRTVHRDDRCPQGEQFLSEYSGSASQIYPRVTRPNMPCENRPEEMKSPRKSAPSITSGPGRGDLLVETRPTRQPGRRGPGSLIQFTALHLRGAKFAIAEANHTKAIISTDAPVGRVAPGLEATAQAIAPLTGSRATCIPTADTHRCAGVTKHSPPIRHAKRLAPSSDTRTVLCSGPEAT